MLGAILKQQYEQGGEKGCHCCEKCYRSWQKRSLAVFWESVFFGIYNLKERDC